MTIDTKEDVATRTDNLAYKLDGTLYTALDKLQRYISDDSTEAARNLASTVSDLTYARRNMLDGVGTLDS